MLFTVISTGTKWSGEISFFPAAADNSAFCILNSEFGEATVSPPLNVRERNQNTLTQSTRVLPWTLSFK